MIETKSQSWPLFGFPVKYLISKCIYTFAKKSHNNMKFWSYTDGHKGFLMNFNNKVVRSIYDVIFIFLLFHKHRFICRIDSNWILSTLVVFPSLEMLREPKYTKECQSAMPKFQNKAVSYYYFLLSFLLS